MVAKCFQGSSLHRKRAREEYVERVTSAACIVVLAYSENMEKRGCVGFHFQPPISLFCLMGSMIVDRAYSPHNF